MKIKGLVRAVQNLHEEGFGIDVLVTDRKSQISKWERENLPRITDHHYDIWYVAKGISLIYNVWYLCKMEALSKEKDSEVVSCK